MIWRFLVTAAVQDDDSAKTARRLSAIALLAVALIAVYSVIWLMIMPQYSQRLALFLPPTFTLLGAALFLIRKGWLQAAVRISLGGSWVVITLITITAGGTLVPFYGLYTLLLMIAALFAGWRSTAFFFTLSCLTGLVMVHLSNRGFIAEPIVTPMSAWLTQTAIMTLLTLTAHIVVRDTDQAFRRSQEELTERQRAEEALRESERHTRRFQEYLKSLHSVNIELSQAQSLDDFFLKAVELGRDQLGFDRVGVWLYDSKTQTACGTYGTDETGQTVDERHFRFPVDAFPFDKRILSGEQQAVLHDPIMITSLAGEERGMGWLAQVSIWDGAQVVGYLSVDNLLNHRPPLPYQMELLALFATMLGHLYSRKQAEIALRESETKYRLLYTSMSEGSGLYELIYDESGKAIDYWILDVNPGYEATTGYGREQVVGKRASEITVPTKLPIYAEVVETGKPASFDAYFSELGKHLSVSVFWVGGSRFATLFTDITERKQAETALRESEERYRILSELASDYAYSYRVDADKTYELEWFTEEPFLRITGVPREEVQNSISLYHPDDLPLVQQDMASLLEGNPNERDYRIYTRSGELRWLHVVRYPVWDAQQGRVVRFYGVGKDITERKRAEAAIQALNAELERRVEQRTVQLAGVNKELEAFAYSVSHDLRAPLRSIDGFSRMILDLYADRLDKTGQNYLNRIRASTQRMGDMLDALLALSRVTRWELHPQPVDLSAMAQEIVAALVESEPARTAHIMIAPSLTAEGDSRLLRIALENLLSNAWKYTSKTPDAVIEFGCETHDGEPIFFVRDNGAGFDPAFMDRLFGVFQRLHNDSEFPGTGVGLATVQRIMHRHGGTIWARSEVGSGSTFYFSLHGQGRPDEHPHEKPRDLTGRG